MIMKEDGESTDVLMLDCVSDCGSKYCATISELFCTSRRLKSTKKEAFLLIDPPTFPLHIRVEKSGLFVEKGLRELKTPSPSISIKEPRSRSVPGLVRISMRPKPRRSYSAENGFWFTRISRIDSLGGNCPPLKPSM